MQESLKTHQMQAEKLFLERENEIENIKRQVLEEQESKKKEMRKLINIFQMSPKRNLNQGLMLEFHWQSLYTKQQWQLKKALI